MRGKGFLVISRHRIADTIIPLVGAPMQILDLVAYGCCPDRFRRPTFSSKNWVYFSISGFPGDYLDNLHRRCAGVAQQGDGDTNLST